MLPIIPLAATIGDKLDSTFFDFDTAVFSFFGSLQSSVMTIIAKLFTSLGDENFIIPVAVIALLLCAFKKTRKYGVAVLAAVAVGTILTNLWLKPMVLRVRPYNTLQLSGFWPDFSKWYAAVGSLSESDYSFPSGHTTSAFEVATAVCLCLISDKKGKVAWIPPVLALGTACSRIYLMVHYPTDVCAGMIIGIVAGVIGFLAALIAIKICEKIGFEDIFKLKNFKPVYALLAVVLIAVLGFSFGHLMTESDEEKCAYSEEYDCNNKARIGEEKYPAINGKNYCKIHWKQITAEQAEGADADESLTGEVTDSEPAPAESTPATEAASEEATAEAA